MGERERTYVVVVHVEDVEVGGGKGDGALDFARGDVVAAFGEGAGGLELVGEVGFGEVVDKGWLEVVEVLLHQGLVDFGGRVACHDGGDGCRGERGSECVKETHCEGSSEWLVWRCED